MTVRVVTDSTCDLPPELAAEYGVSVVPVTILFGEEPMLDGVDITAEQFFKRLPREKQVPTTSQPAAGMFVETWESLVRDGADEICSIHLSGKLSGTIESARMAASSLDGTKLEIVDSGQVSVALGLPVLAAAAAARSGASLEEVVRIATDVASRTTLFVIFDTLEYLRRGGRMNRGMELFGSLLQVKPIASIVDGELVPVARVRTRVKAIEEVVRRVQELRPIEHAAVMHATSPEDLEFLVGRVRGLAPDADVFTNRITPALGVHTGPGVLGLAVVRARDSST